MKKSAASLWSFPPRRQNGLPFSVCEVVTPASAGKDDRALVPS